ncbi:DUF1579 domain-containing protein [Flaviflagellibacter deserti]|uniref:DUF1579 domain-containing protein n=1 Tax=Flaviflagellibacter deserti TaxID=2267266 RepID=A0ABV9Z627_9HYPH
MMNSEPQAEHKWLEKLLGDWIAEADMPTPEGEKLEPWKEHVRTIGGLWIQGEATGDMPGGGKGSSVLTLGYDPAKGKYVGSWFGSMMAYLWHYEGSVDDSGNKLTLDTVGPSFSPEGGGGTADYQDIIEFHGSDKRTLTSMMKQEDGSWQQVMQMTYRRAG